MSLIHLRIIESQFEISIQCVYKNFCYGFYKNIKFRVLIKYVHKINLMLFKHISFKKIVIIPCQLHDIFSNFLPTFQVVDKPVHIQFGTTYIAFHSNFP